MDSSLKDMSQLTTEIRCKKIADILQISLDFVEFQAEHNFILKLIITKKYSFTTPCKFNIFILPSAA